MKPWHVFATVTLGLSALTSAAALREAVDAPEAPAWLSDVEAAFATAREAGKPLLVAFR
jgi:hypothetical protein